MNDFAAAALPWVLAGIALALLAVSHGAEAQTDAKRGTRLAAGAGLGLLLGVVLNGCGFWENHAIGLALGPLWGMALAALYQGGNGEEDDSSEK